MSPGGLYRGPGRAGGGQAAGEGGLTHPDSPSLPAFSIQTESAALQGSHRLAQRRARNEKLEKLKRERGGGRRGAGEVIGVPSLHLLGQPPPGQANAAQELGPSCGQGSGWIRIIREMGRQGAGVDGAMGQSWGNGGSRRRDSKEQRERSGETETHTRRQETHGQMGSLEQRWRV